MEQRDYLIKQINQLTQALRKILSDLLNLSNTNSKSEYFFSVNNEKLNDLYNIKLQNIIDLSCDELITKIISAKNFEPEQILILSEITELLAENYSQTNKKNSQNLYKKIFIC